MPMFEGLAVRLVPTRSAGKCLKLLFKYKLRFGIFVMPLLQKATNSVSKKLISSIFS